MTAGETAPNSTPQTLGAGGYSYQATYNGNANYTSKTGGCEPFKVSQATQSVATMVLRGVSAVVEYDIPVSLGTATRDSASLGGKVGSFSLDSSATVSYVFFTSNDCSAGGGPAEIVTVTAGETVPDSTPQTLDRKSVA